MTRLTVRPSAFADSGLVAAAARIYADAFPDRLRVPFEQLADTGPRDELHIALDAGVPVGFAAVRLLESARWTFLRYFAIDSGRRRERLGLGLWEALAEAVTADGWPGRICLEVEDPADADGDPAEREVRLARVRFWERCGTAALPVPGYVTPDFTGLGAAEPMLLMATAADAARTRGPELTALIVALYTERYQLEPEDSLVRRALESIGP